tara:strand:+ start:5221 stop:6165 length:945 start_codon:yes stop_codon:yes gene_type:complete
MAGKIGNYSRGKLEKIIREVSGNGDDDVNVTGSIANNRLVKGDDEGGTQHVQQTGIIIDDSDNISNTGHIIPAGSGSANLGSADNPFGSLYLSSSTLYLGAESISSDAQGDIQIGSGDASKGMKISNVSVRGNSVSAVNGYDLNLSSAAGDIHLHKTTFISSSLFVTGTNRIGVGVSSATHALTLANTASNDGKGIAYAWATYSSERYKENIKTINEPLVTLSKIRGVTFDWKNSGQPDYGFIAEEVGEHIPEVVDWEEDSDAAKGMYYQKVIPILVESIKEQQEQIKNQKNEINQLKEMIEKMKNTEQDAEQI